MLGLEYLEAERAALGHALVEGRVDQLLRLAVELLTVGEGLEVLVLGRLDSLGARVDRLGVGGHAVGPRGIQVEGLRNALFPRHELLGGGDLVEEGAEACSDELCSCLVVGLSTMISGRRSAFVFIDDDDAKASIACAG